MSNNTELTVISAYNSPSRRLQAKDLNTLLDNNHQILLAGDSKNQNWNCITTNNRITLQEHADLKTIDAPTALTHYTPTGTADILDIMLLKNANLRHTVTTQIHALSLDYLPIVIINIGEGDDDPI